MENAPQRKFPPVTVSTDILIAPHERVEVASVGRPIDARELPELLGRLASPQTRATG